MSLLGLVTRSHFMGILSNLDGGERARHGPAEARRVRKVPVAQRISPQIRRPDSASRHSLAHRGRAGFDPWPFRTSGLDGAGQDVRLGRASTASCFARGMHLQVRAEGSVAPRVEGSVAPRAEGSVAPRGQGVARACTMLRGMCGPAAISHAMHVVSACTAWPHL